MRRIELICGVLLGALALCAPAAAQPTPDQTSAIQSNCRVDFLSKCSGVKRGGIEAFQCLKNNEASLSAGCRAAVNAVKIPEKETPKQAEPASKPASKPQPPLPSVAAPAPPSAPTPPVAPKASSVKPAEPKSPDTKTVQKTLPKPKEKPAAGPAIDPPKPVVTEPAEPRLTKQEEEALVRQSCSLDYGLNCFGVPYGEGRILACLRQNAMKLTAGCSAAIKLVRPR